ncbi:hypothetical protein CH333_10370 [candidate division WOR-3 bacterium JGI_Cruoil_03_44_89]|uniref:DUF6754 domain-containing protein n=1 Tax=candidate division WOR-3 bacterium JGI_Cruoil_03_44_89 TaxID=1973748 RepID=A0A235BQ48_UNCW3|nr:MAG: hypothetical protein CH333_10370 [candidate division WOR-3 bacterium JGI_Cruoil_03_44_89]
MEIILSLLLSFAAPSNVRAYDTPNDAGSSITIEWKISADDSLLQGYEIWRSELPDTGFSMIGYAGRGMSRYRDLREIKNGREYYYKIRGRTRELFHTDFSNTSLPAIASYQWFNRNKVNTLFAVVIFMGILFYFVSTAKKGKSLFIRKITGLDALDEAVGRATEMGRPVMYVPGLSTMSDVATIASINILQRVSKKIAEYDTRLIVPIADAIVYMVARQVTKEGYMEAGRPDSYNEDSVFFVTDSQFAYAAAVSGIMIREKPATNLFLGMFWAESLLLAETGNMTGAVQIAGTDSVTQLPFFVTACDYTIIGEELYAASAYLSKEPILTGSIKAQDLGKLIILILIVLGILTGIFGFNFFSTMLNV